MRVRSRHRLVVTSIGLLAASCAAPALPQTAPPAPPSRPNIVFILADDHAPWALGRAGHPHARTPNLDRLCREGAYLRNAFVVTPVCSPSRASLITSRYGTEVGITDWLNPKEEPDHGLPPELPAWPRILAEAGYATGLVGKWHLGLPDRFHPSVFGYSHFMGFRGGGTQPKDPLLEAGGQERRFPGFEPDILTDEAIAFLRRQTADRPFLLSLHFRSPHRAWLPVSDADWAPFKDLDPVIPNPDYPKLDVPQVKQITREYLASVSGVDRNVGRLLAAIEELSLADRTVVVYTSDHGYNLGHNGIWHKGNGRKILTDDQGWRPNLYDNSLRVPTIVRWPGAVRPGTVVERTVSNLDWFPTLLAMAGVEPPAGAILRGRNALPVLRGESVPWDDDLYAQYTLHHEARAALRGYRAPEWKLVRDFQNPGKDELYHLVEDPAETKNRIDDPAAREIRRELEAKLQARMKSIGDPARGR